MSVVSRVRIYLMLLLLGSVMGACQRVSYQFKNSEKTDYELNTAVAQPECAVLAAMAPSVAPLRKPSATASHVSQRTERIPVVMSRVACSSSVLALRISASPTLAVAASQAQQEPQPGSQPVNWRSRGIAFILALFLGILGGHLFYLGLHKRAITYLLLTLASFAIIAIAAAGVNAASGMGAALYILLAIPGLFLFYAVAILALIDAIRILTGALKPQNGEYYPRFFQTRAGKK